MTENSVCKCYLAYAEVHIKETKVKQNIVGLACFWNDNFCAQGDLNKNPKWLIFQEIIMWAPPSSRKLPGIVIFFIESELQTCKKLLEQHCLQLPNQLTYRYVLKLICSPANINVTNITNNKTHYLQKRSKTCKKCQPLPPWKQEKHANLLLLRVCLFQEVKIQLTASRISMGRI